MLITATFRFHFTLNDFLALADRNAWVKYSFRDEPAVKDAIEALGVPHPEVDIIVVNCAIVDFNYKLQPNDQVEVYPASPYTMWPEKAKLIPKSTLPYRFVLDVHLGKLARLLRLLGFDTIFDAGLTDKEIAGISVSENRILLTRSVGLLKLKSITRDYWLRSQHPEMQVQEVVSYYKLAPEFKLFSRCMVCNGNIKAVPKEQIWELLPPKTRLYFHEFYQCQSCQRVYWKGSHYERMQEFISKLLQ
ncbi:Mut7-C ubiquitin/RNAse domain-containing protein [Pontibacter sp. KCTC 32443]|uniref:Mut7-C RNAse domain-containing protein n=1 Tax=Pontibacter TaxID=323449 RepID=UPI00164E9930|nr:MULTISPECIES: Mut7-C RNAse domain-containing protein [Pontibacter]MBC5774773.1 Mut7-C ubiquitin/RNAse domain-containing protein [Pontibacter sp. KCTC 32443]